MDDLNRKKPNKRQRSAVPNGVAVAADTAAPNTADEHGPGAALEPTADGAAASEIVQPPARKKGRVKSVRASFAVPKGDHATLDALKEACGAHGVPAKKNQLLRVAIGLLREIEPPRLAQLVAALPPAARKKK